MDSVRRRLLEKKREDRDIDMSIYYRYQMLKKNYKIENSGAPIGYQHSVFYKTKQKTRAHACILYGIPYKMYCHVRPLGVYTDVGQLHSHRSNVLTCCIWAHTRRRIGVISDGCYYGWVLLRMGVTADGYYYGWVLLRMGVITDGCYYGWVLLRMGVITDGCYFGWVLLRAFTEITVHTAPALLNC